MLNATTETEIEARYHYQVIARAIKIIDAAGAAPLPLDTLAAELGLSTAHFQRLFSRWVGVSPKRYQQYLTLGTAKLLLTRRFTTLDTSLATGLSGSGRLHDLFLRWEAMSPGDYAKAGAGLSIAYGFHDTPFGEALAMTTDKGLCGLAFCAEIGRDAAMAEMRARWPNAAFVSQATHANPLLAAAFTQSGHADLHLIGAPFQIKVWEALLAIPSGQVASYGQIASAIGASGAARAVGTAVGRNPIGFLIPCHRCLRQNGALGGYHWGLPVKRAMLGWEAARHDASSPNSDRQEFA
jgi:AraC family transcriptional regulator of adaptative response/methylated-DNA-[protein]-cysteine methyltransferase